MGARDKMENNSNFVRVGVASWIINPQGQVLLGRRTGAHGRGLWGAPGGHMETGEEPVQTAIRETIEETGIVLNPNNIQITFFTNDIFPDKQKHYITIHCVTRLSDNVTVELREPDKCAEWRWFDVDNLPSELFLPAQKFLARYKLRK